MTAIAPSAFKSFATLGVAGQRKPASAPVDVGEAYAAWRDGLKTKAVSSDFVAGLDSSRATFLAVARRAQETGGLDDPQAFLKSLSTDELNALQTTAELGDPINPATLSREGAYNLLVTRGQARDLDQDGLTEVGVARTIVFPPQDAPANVRAAWDSAMAGQDEGTRMTLSLSAWMGTHGRPLDAEGSKAGWSEADFDWTDAARRLVAGARENLKYQASAEQQRHGVAALRAFEAFLANLAGPLPA